MFVNNVEFFSVSFEIYIKRNNTKVENNIHSVNIFLYFAAFKTQDAFIS